MGSTHRERSKQIVDFLQDAEGFTDADFQRLSGYSSDDMMSALAYAVGNRSDEQVARVRMFAELKQQQLQAAQQQKIAVMSGLFGILGALAGVILGSYL